MEITNTFIVATARHSDFIFKCLDSLKKHTPPNYRVIVIDQTQTDLEWEAELRKRCDLWLKTKLNYGFAQGMNFGIRLASPTKYVTCANDDLVFMPLWWEGILETFEKFPTVLGVNPESPLEPGWGYGKEGFIKHMEYKEEFTEEDVAKLREIQGGRVVDGITTWCTVFKHEPLVEKVGLFDERFIPGGGEDYDLSARAYQAGFRLLGSSFSWVWHWWGIRGGLIEDSMAPLPQARPSWNKLSTKCDLKEGLWDPDCDVWGSGCTRVHPEIFRAPL